MIGRCALALLIVVASPALWAETYKWVDAKGITNYSNAPPSNANSAKSLKTVEERISVYTPDPNLGRLADIYRRLDLIEADYRMRQAYLPNYAAASLAATGGCTWPIGPICDHGHGYRMGSYPTYVTYPVFLSPPVRRTSFVATAFSHRGGAAHGGSRRSR